jgi:hypothetical protein
MLASRAGRETAAVGDGSGISAQAGRARRPAGAGREQDVNSCARMYRARSPMSGRSAYIDDADNYYFDDAILFIIRMTLTLLLQSC